MVGGRASWRRSPGAAQPPFDAHQEPVVDQLGEQLLDEERVPLGGLADVGPELRRQRRRDRGGWPPAPRSRPRRAARATWWSPSACRRPTSAASRAARRAPSRSAGSGRRASSRRCARSGRGRSARPSGCRRRRGSAACCAPAPRTSCGWPRRSRPAPWGCPRCRAGRRRWPRSARPPAPRRAPAAGARSRPRGASPSAIPHPSPNRLGHRPVGDPLPVGQAATGGDLGLLAQCADELVDHARLPDPGRRRGS